MIPAYPVRWSPHPGFVLAVVIITLWWVPFWSCHDTTRFNRESKEQSP